MTTVLIVNSQPAPANTMGDILRQQGHDVRLACSAEAALRLVAAGPPDLVISEVDLPGLNGLALCHRLCRDLPSLPVLLLQIHADANAQDNWGNTALMLAADGQDGMVRMLLDSQAAVNTRNSLGKTALAIAVSKGMDSTAALLRAAGGRE